MSLASLPGRRPLQLPDRHPPVLLVVIDTEEELDVKLPVKDFKVAIDKGLLKNLEMHPYLMPKINS